MKRGRYYKSLKEWINAGHGNYPLENGPCIHVSGSVKGMRKQFLGYECDVVRVGNWIYKVN